MPRRILVIDDDAPIRALAQAGLALVGKWEVLTAASGAEGIAKASAARPDAILLDVVMPDMDGPAALGALRANPATAHIPIVMLTAKSADDADLSELPVTGVIAKPFDLMGLAGQVADALGWEL